MSHIKDVFEFLVSRYHGGNRGAAADHYGISRGQFHGFISGQQTNPTLKVLNAIISAHPELNAQWLLTGNGQPLQMPVSDELELLRSQNEEMRADIRAIIAAQKKYL